MAFVNTAAFAQSTAAGFIPGSFGVGPSGAATYTIPIQVPPGVAGMEPKLALSYNSQAGNGLLGVGWNLEGLSSVSRCPRTMAQDGVRGSVNFDNNDRFCLDGQRLIAINGTYGADGTEYRTEREAFAKIVSYGTAGNGPAWFKVWTKSGQIMEYGNTTDSRIEAQGKVTIAVWAQNKVSDTSDNSYVVSYAEDAVNAEYLVAGLAYGGSTQHISVSFAYESRVDMQSKYISGSSNKLTKRLKKITVAAPGVVHTYELSYEEKGVLSWSRLTSIRFCDSTGQCIAPSTITYSNDGGNAFTPDVATGLDGQFSGWKIYPGDFNGDGLTDLFLDEGKGTYRKRIVLGKRNGTFTSDIATGHDGAFIGWNPYLADFNGDGKTDIFFDEPNGTYRKRIVLSNGDGTLSNNIATGLDGQFGGWKPYLADFNGDGRADIFFDEDKLTYRKRIALSQGNGALSNGIATGLDGALPGWKAYVGDFNGDGLADIFFDEDKGSYRKRIALSKGDGTLTNDIATGLDGQLAGWKVHLSDFNGDGLTDIFFDEDKSLYRKRVALSKGDGTLTSDINTGLDGALSGWKIYPGDFNGDGLTDIFFDEAKGTYRKRVSLSKGNGQFTNDYDIGHDGAFANWQLYSGDFDGDGRVDFLASEAVGTYRKRVVLSRFLRPGFLSALTSGMGSTDEISYKALTNTEVYIKLSDASYPTVDIQPPIFVVASTKTSAGQGNFRELRYTYHGAKADLLGRGFLGFKKVNTIDAQVGLITNTRYRQDFPYTGLPIAQTVQTMGGAVLKQADTTYNCTDFVSSSGCIVVAGRRYFPFAQAVIEQSWDLNGVALPTVTTSYQYDAWGNATQVQVGTGDGYSKTTTNAYVNDSSKWFLGRLQRSSVTSVVP